MAETITLSIKEHRGKERLFAGIPYIKEWTAMIKSIPGARWSQSKKQWHFAIEQKTVSIIKERFAKLATIDVSLLREQLKERKQKQQPAKSVILAEKPEALLPWQQNKIDYTPVIIIEARRIPIQRAETNKTPERNKFPAPPVHLYTYLQKLIDKAKLKGYSPHTVINYHHHFHTYLLTVYGLKDIDRITKDEIEKYLRWRQKHNTYSESDQNQHINAIKFYYEQVLGRERMLFDLPRPKMPRQLPAVWSESDVIKIIKTINNLKHRCLLLMVYAHGLRVSEIAALKIADIDSKRMQIHIKAAKGKRDRVVTLSETVLTVLRTYYKEFKPKIYLFENYSNGEPISTRTIQQIFTDAKNKAGLKKKAGIHSLRHSYATHLHEQGIDIKFLKELLGHSSLKTTERYTHVSKKDISNIKSPLDHLKF